MSDALAGRYATALVDIVFSDNAPLSPEEAIEQLRTFEAMVASAADLRGILKSPAVSRPRKRAIVGKLAEESAIGSTIRNFLYVLIDRGRAALIPELRHVVETFIDARRGIARAYVTSAASLSDSEKLAIGAELSRVTGKQVQCSFEVDQALLGGVSARIGSTVYDGSVRGRLSALKSRLTA